VVGTAALGDALSARSGLALALIAFAALAALLAADLLGVRSAMRQGDREFALDPASASWSSGTVLPFDAANRSLGTGPDLAFRRTARAFEAAVAAGSGFDNGASEAAARGEVEGDLAAVARGGSAARVSAADNMLGILAFADSQRTGPNAPAPVEQSVGDFQAAVRADPSSDTAKYNLELLLHKLAARGSRRGSNGTAGGLAHGRRGAGGGVTGRGY
jgi:hypothetical protein